jgi:hypothetical protein
MRTWMRSVVSTILGRAPGKIRSLDAEPRTAMDADFDNRNKSGARGLQSARDDARRPVQIETSADIELFDQILRVVMAKTRR